MSETSTNAHPVDNKGARIIAWTPSALRARLDAGDEPTRCRGCGMNAWPEAGGDGTYCRHCKPGDESTTTDAPIVEPSKVQLHDFQFARKFSEDPRAFTHEFIGRLASTTAQTPEGRKAWADALKAMTA